MRWMLRVRQNFDTKVAGARPKDRGGQGVVSRSMGITLLSNPAWPGIRTFRTLDLGTKNARQVAMRASCQPDTRAL